MIKSQTFKDAKVRFNDRNDKNFCVPMALGILSNTDPVDVAELMEAHGRRRRGSGCPMSTVLVQAKELQLKLREVTHSVLTAGGKTVNSITKIVDPSKNYLVGVRGHVLAIIKGEVHDWTNDRKHRVTNVYEIEDGEAGVLRVNDEHVRTEAKTADLVSQIKHLSQAARILKSGAEARLIYHGYTNNTCYIRKSRNGYTLQYSLKNAYHEIAPSHIEPTNITTQYANYEFSTLEEAVQVADKAAERTRY